VCLIVSSGVKRNDMKGLFAGLGNGCEEAKG
jgi:hypothetical protein